MPAALAARFELNHTQMPVVPGLPQSQSVAAWFCGGLWISQSVAHVDAKGRIRSLPCVRSTPSQGAPGTGNRTIDESARPTFAEVTEDIFLSGPERKMMDPVPSGSSPSH